MAKKRKTKSRSVSSARSSARSSASFIDASALKSFFNSPMGRQLLADVVMAAAAAAAAALLASNRGGKAMGRAAMQSAQGAVLGVVSNAMQGKRR